MAKREKTDKEMGDEYIAAERKAGRWIDQNPNSFVKRAPGEAGQGEFAEYRRAIKRPPKDPKITMAVAKREDQMSVTGENARRRMHNKLVGGMESESTSESTPAPRSTPRPPKASASASSTKDLPTFQNKAQSAEWRQQASDYNTMKTKADNYKPDTKKSTTKSSGSFGSAFSSARSSGAKEFEWNGKKYHTKLKSEMGGSKSSSTASKSVAKSTPTTAKTTSAPARTPQPASKTKAPAKDWAMVNKPGRSSITRSAPPSATKSSMPTAKPQPKSSGRNYVTSFDKLENTMRKGTKAISSMKMPKPKKKSSTNFKFNGPKY